jgi:hypothetical protein
MAQSRLSGLGTWSSPVTSDIVASDAVRFDSRIAISGQDIYWIEQHGFRQGPHVKRALEAEFSFYAMIFGFAPTEYIEPVKIENLG